MQTTAIYLQAHQYLHVKTRKNEQLGRQSKLRMIVLP